MTQRTAAAQRTKYVLDETDLPTQWYNIQADLKTLYRRCCIPAPGNRSARRIWRPCFLWP